MISKHIHIKPQNASYTRLANYIADASHEGEKSLMSWCSGCWAGDDYELGIMEVNATQELNLRTTKSKTYHLVISFRPEDEATLSPERFKEIEEAFASALGLTEHQRHCGVHKNTDNMHMHVAYNLIHPEKLTIHHPFRDYIACDKVCRELEQKYGLAIDNGRSTKRDPQKLTEMAARLEAQTGQQSFEGYAKSHQESILADIQNATSWQDVHSALGKFGMETHRGGKAFCGSRASAKKVRKCQKIRGKA